MDRQRAEWTEARKRVGDGAESIADRLQTLSLTEAEEVLKRAIQLQFDSEDTRAGLDTDALQRVADELGIAREHLTRALAEQLFDKGDPHRTLLDRLLIPESLTVAGAVDHEYEKAEGAVIEWLNRHEGLRMRSRRSSGAVWEKDRSLAASARMKLNMSQGTGSLRGARWIAHDLKPLDGNRQILTVKADSSNIKKVGIGLLVGSAIAGAAAGVASAVGLDAVSALEGIATGLTTFIAAAAVSLTAVRSWASRLKRGLERAIDAVRHPSLMESPNSIPSRLRRFFDDWMMVRNDIARDWKRSDRGG